MPWSSEEETVYQASQQKAAATRDPRWGRFTLGKEIQKGTQEGATPSGESRSGSVTPRAGKPAKGLTSRHGEGTEEDWQRETGRVLDAS